MTAPLGTQIDLTHVDAHGDFTAGFRNFSRFDRGIPFIFKTLLYHLPKERPCVIDKNPGHVTLANYMSFAVACRWVERVEFVTHPQWTLDIPDGHFKDNNSATGLLEFHAKGMDPEPLVPITFQPRANFSQTGFAHAFLCQSPNYTPQTADALIPVFEDYIDFNAS
jgi:hypothetical protein